MSTPPDVPILPVRRSLWERVSVVWLIPIAALLITLGVAWQSWSERGPLITIAFDSASGVKAGETVLRYRDVDVGLVENVRFSPSLEKVDVTVRLDKEIAPFVDRGAEFWVVRPEVTTQGVSGLDTVLSGVFIEGYWDTTPGDLVETHTGRETAPLLRVGEQGTRITLRVIGDAVLNENSPIVYKGIRVGRTGEPRLNRRGTQAISEAIIYAPHDALINTATRFWDTSGFSFSIGANGAQLDFSSLASLISGGLTFETIVSGGTPVSDSFVFDVYPSEEDARASVFSGASGPTLAVGVEFQDNVSGLTAGAPVEYGGVRIGEVTGLRGLVDADRFGDENVRLLVSLVVRPERLGLDSGTTPEAALAFLSDRIDEGLRARLATASILTGGLKIELILDPDAPTARLERPAGSLPIIPTTADNVQDVAATAQGVLQRVDDLPIEEVMASIVVFLDNASALVGSDDIRSVPGEVAGLLADARGVIGAEEVQQLPETLNRLLASLQDTTEDLRGILGQIEEADGIDRLLSAVDAAGSAAAEVETALAPVPSLLEQIEAVAAKADALPLEDLLDQANALLAAAETLIAADSTRALPGALNDAMADLRRVVAEVTDQDGIARLLATIDAAGAAAADASTSFEGVPALVDRLASVAAKAEALAVEDLIAELTAVVQSADALLASDGTQGLPATLSAALEEVRTVLAELRAGGTVDNVNTTLASAAVAADAVALATQDLPGLVQRINALMAQAAATLEGLDGDSALSRDARSALREIQKAADSVASLARALERRPNSIILGR